VWREQSELALLREQVQRAGRQGRAVLMIAGIEYLGQVECDPYTLMSPSEDHGFWGYNVCPPKWFATERRAEILTLATHLRRMVNLNAGDVSKSVWDDAEGYRGVRRAAVTKLAARAEPAWSDTRWRRFDVPVRSGALLAWQQAKVLESYLDAGPPPE
jgi:hypothetical protein